MPFSLLVETYWNSHYITRCKIYLLLIADVALCKKLLDTRCIIHSLLVEVARCSLQKSARSEIRSLLVAELLIKNHSLVIAKF